MTDTATDQIVDIVPDQIDPDPNNLRRRLGDLRDLTASIKARGILEPLTVGQANGEGRYPLVFGHRRLAAAIKAELDTVPCIVRDWDEEQRIEAQLIENLQREGLSYVEEAHGYMALVERGYTVGRLAKRIGRSQRVVRERLALLELPADILERVETGQVTLEAAGELRRLYATNEEVPESIVEQVLDYLGAGRNPEGVVDAALAETKRAAALAKITARLERSGKQYAVQTSWGRPDEAADWKLINEGWDALALDADAVKEHDKLDCLRILVVASPGQKPRVVRACADPKAHTTKRAERESGVTDAGMEQRAAERERRRAERERERQVEEAWRRRLQTAVRGAKPTEVTELLARWVLTRVTSEDHRTLCRALSLEPHRVEDPYGGKRKDGSPKMRNDWTTPLLEHVAASRAELVRTALAATLTLPAGWSEGGFALNERTRTFLAQFPDPGPPDEQEGEGTLAEEQE